MSSSRSGVPGAPTRRTRPPTRVDGRCRWVDRSPEPAPADVDAEREAVPPGLTDEEPRRIDLGGTDGGAPARLVRRIVEGVARFDAHPVLHDRAGADRLVHTERQPDVAATSGVAHVAGLDRAHEETHEARLDLRRDLVPGGLPIRGDEGGPRRQEVRHHHVRSRLIGEVLELDLVDDVSARRNRVDAVGEVDVEGKLSLERSSVAETDEESEQPRDGERACVPGDRDHDRD
jgi:hypothetical protein